jgi:hypothetical protein
MMAVFCSYFEKMEFNLKKSVGSGGEEDSKSLPVAEGRLRGDDSGSGLMS